MVSMRQAADRFAYDIIERLRGASLSAEGAAEIISAVRARTVVPHPADAMVEHIVRSLSYGLPPGILTDEHVARIVRAATTAGQRPHEFNIPRQTNAERDAGRKPGDTEPWAPRRADRT